MPANATSGKAVSSCHVGSETPGTVTGVAVRSTGLEESKRGPPANHHSPRPTTAKPMPTDASVSRIHPGASTVDRGSCLRKASPVNPHASRPITRGSATQQEEHSRARHGTKWGRPRLQPAPGQRNTHRRRRAHGGKRSERHENHQVQVGRHKRLHVEPATSRQLRPLVVDAAFHVQSVRLVRCREPDRPEKITPVFEARNLTKRYGRLTALSDVSFSVREGEVLGLIGPNGSGKTTLFECLGGVLPLDGGRSSATGAAAHGTGARVHAVLSPRRDRALAVATVAMGDRLHPRILRRPRLDARRGRAPTSTSDRFSTRQSAAVEGAAQACAARDRTADAAPRADGRRTVRRPRSPPEP